jgi:hypothetical protein
VCLAEYTVGRFAILAGVNGLSFSVGDKVLASRDETGVDHELATVVDSHELIIGEDRRPMVTVEFEDGERRYLKATPPNVLAVELEEDEEGEPGEGEADEDERLETALPAEADAASSTDGDEDLPRP